jgi:Xaa-Pro aminopeptidase
VGGQIANQLNKRGLKRVGVMGMEYIPYGWLETIKAAVPGVTFVDVWDDFHLLRLTKSEEEVALIREAARISDLCWAEMPNIVKAGRKRYEVLGDLEHIIRSNGCEDSFNMCMSLPMLQEKLDRSPYSALPIEDGKVYLIEVSPRFVGYYAQQTGPVTVGCDMPDEMLAAYNAVNHAREKALELMKPGVDLADVGPVVAETLKSDGFEAPSPSFGHAIGLELEDQHINGKSLVLQEGMTFIFHPFAAGHPAVMRADTYLITADGVERITTGDIGPLQC